jgi:hypothetical protein
MCSWLSIRLAAVGATLATLVSVAAAQGPPEPLRGVPLVGPTGLRLLVADNPPFVLDVDSGRITRVKGLDVRGHTVLSVTAAGKDAVVWLDRPTLARKVPAAEIYVVRRGAARASRIATGWDFAPAADGHALWVKSYKSARHCVLSEVGLGGRLLRGPRAVSCAMRIVDGGRGALLIQGATVTDPLTRRTLLSTRGLWAVAGDFALTSAAGGALTLVDLRSGAQRSLPWPSETGSRDEAAVRPDGKLIALSFANPSYSPQLIDVWLLDPESGSIEHLPDMPAGVSLKFTSMSWTMDGRLVFLAETGGADVVAVWRPGEARIAVRKVRIPTRDSGSDSFVLW